MKEKMSVQQASKVVDLSHKVLDVSLKFIREKCLDEAGRISSSELDLYQLVLYDLAYSYAEIVAARVMLDYSSRIREQQGDDSGSSVEENISLNFCAQAVQNVRVRFAVRHEEFGISRAVLNDSLESSEVQQFCSETLTSEKIADLGRHVLDMDGGSGSYLLEEDKEIMRGVFASVTNDVVAPLAEDIHRNDLLVPNKILDVLTEMGCFALSIPEQYGGLQPDGQEDNLGMIVVTEELSRGSLAAAGSLITRPEILSRALLAGGTEAQKQHWLPKLAVGAPLCAVAITEPGFGSDVAGARLKAEKVEGGWRLNGEKTWCTFAGKAGVLLTLARTNSNLDLGHKGLSIFLVEKPAFDGHEFECEQEEGGILSGKSISTIGYRGMHSFSVFYDNYFVPDENLLGGDEGLGRGFYYAMSGFSGGRIQTAARANGVMQAAFESAVSYSKERKVFGLAVGEYKLTLVKLATMATLLMTSRQFTYAVGRMMDRGEGQMEASLVKLFACKTSEWLTREAMQIHGGMGYAEESAISRYWIDARVLSIFEGAEEILAIKVIARALIESAK